MGGEGGIPSNFSKGPVHRAMDAQLNYRENGVFVKRGEILRLLKNPENRYADMLKTVFQAPTYPAEYVAAHWYNPDPEAPGTWWKEKQPIEPIIRQSLIHAIELAEELPIDSYWAPIGNREVHPNNYHKDVFRTDEFPFEVVLSRGAHQLTRVIITPPSPRPRNTQLYTTPAAIWVVNHRYESRPIGHTTTSGDVAMTQLYEQSGFPSGGYPN